jgi:hypothetical protein
MPLSTVENGFFVRHRRKILLALIALFAIMGVAAAAVFTMFYTSNTATVKSPDVQLAAGSDSSGSSVYPSASVNVASTHDSATVAFTLFPSEACTPQPKTYYSDLLRISNVGSSSHTISSITITSLSGASNLGSLTIYYYASQTNDPENGSPLGSATLTSGSSAPITIFSGSHSLAASTTNYIEIAGYADSGATIDSTISFAISIYWS